MWPCYIYWRLSQLSTILPMLHKAIIARLVIFHNLFILPIWFKFLGWYFFLFFVQGIFLFVCLVFFFCFCFLFLFLFLFVLFWLFACLFPFSFLLGKSHIAITVSPNFTSYTLWKWGDALQNSHFDTEQLIESHSHCLIMINLTRKVHTVAWALDK